MHCRGFEGAGGLDTSTRARVLPRGQEIPCLSYREVARQARRGTVVPAAVASRPTGEGGGVATALPTAATASALSTPAQQRRAANVSRLWRPPCPWRQRQRCRPLKDSIADSVAASSAGRRSTGGREGGGIGGGVDARRSPTTPRRASNAACATRAWEAAAPASGRKQARAWVAGLPPRDPSARRGFRQARALARTGERAGEVVARSQQLLLRDPTKSMRDLAAERRHRPQGGGRKTK